jgi:hypothetical protein
VTSILPTFYRVLVYSDHYFTTPVYTFYAAEHPGVEDLVLSIVPFTIIDDTLEVVPHPDGGYLEYVPYTAREQLSRTIRRIRVAPSHKSA